MGPRLPEDSALRDANDFEGRPAEDGRIDWTRSAVGICDLVRAFARPGPGAFSMLGGKKCRIWRALPVPAEGFPEVPSPGKMVVAGGTSLLLAGGCLTSVKTEACVLTGTGNGLLRLEEVEWNGKTAKGAAIVSLFKKAIAGGFSGRF